MIGLLELLADEDNPSALLTAYNAASDAETVMALTMVTHNNDPDSRRQFSHADEIYRTAGAELTARPPEALQQWLAGMDILEPGIVPAARWATGPQSLPSRLPEMELTLSAVVRWSVSP